MQWHSLLEIELRGITHKTHHLSKFGRSTTFDNSTVESSVLPLNISIRLCSVRIQSASDVGYNLHHTRRKKNPLSNLEAFWIRQLGSLSRMINAHVRRWTTSNCPTIDEGISPRKSRLSNVTLDGRYSGRGKWPSEMSYAAIRAEGSCMATSIAQSLFSRCIQMLLWGPEDPTRCETYPVPAPMSAIAMPSLMGISGWITWFMCSFHSICWDPSLESCELVLFHVDVLADICSKYLVASARLRFSR